MKKNILCCMLFFLVCLSCNKDEAGPIYNLAFNESLRVDNIDINFYDIEDSRCPEDVQCIIPGFAKVYLSIRDYDVIDLKELCIGLPLDDCPEVSESFNLKFTLKEVNPYPKENDIPEKDDYEIVLEIEKI